MAAQQDYQMAAQMESMSSFTPPPGLAAPPGLSPPPGLGHGVGKQTESPTEEYSIEEKVFTLRSNGSWSPGTIKEIHDDTVVVSLMMVRRAFAKRRRAGS